MSFLEKLRFTWDASGMVAGLIEKWQPKDCKTEKDYELSLYSYLHDELKDVQVTRQFARGRVKADIEVGGQVIIELKHNLKSTAEFHRLVGQLDSYKEWDGRIILVLCGDTEPNLLKDLKARMEKVGDFLGNTRCGVIQKMSC
jgi:hypothetical protein